MRPPWLGIAFIVLAFFCVALMNAITKYAANISVITLVFFQAFVALVITAGWSLKSGFQGLITEHFALLVLRAVMGLASQFLMLLAVREMPLMNATLLANSTPFFVNLIAWYWLKEKVGFMHLISLLIGFIGIICLLKPQMDLLKNTAAIYALLSAVFSAGVFVSIEKISKSDPPERILFYYFSISAILSAPFAFYRWKPIIHPVDWMALMGIGIAMAAAQYLIVLAYQRASASELSPFNYSVVIFSGLFGWLWWNNIPDLLDMLGVILVIVGGILGLKYGAHAAMQKRGKI